MKPNDNAAQLADCIALEAHADQAVRVTISPPAVAPPMSAKLSGEAVTIERTDAVRKRRAISIGK
jgi:hypothetical protein